ncbi:MAG: ATP-binding cassette domain-containing protein [Acidobacteriota bacterium]|nr:ATP-binding cassette domain-containing protein [Acidobacteriota bacterium]
MTAFFECGPFSARDGEGRVLFEDVSLALADGQCVAIEGPSGGGKSTLLRHVTGLAWSPDAVRRLDGEDYPCAQLPSWRTKVSLVAQDAPMISGSVGDNLAFPFTQRAGKGRAFDEGEANRLLGSVGLDRLPLDREVRTLSGGERHRIALVRGLMWDPPVLVADEPLSGLDPDAVSASFELLLTFARRPGRLVLCVFHDPGLNGRADRHLRLADGRLEGVR